MRKLLLAFAIAGLAVASAKTYRVQLYEPALLGTMQLAPGEYRVEVVGDKAVIRNGKVQGEAPVKMEENDKKYGFTTVRFTNADGKLHVQEIHLGGTKSKLVFNE
jgi:hypothetical protein